MKEALKEIPVVDLEENRQENAELLGRAFHDIGFAFVKIPSTKQLGILNSMDFVYSQFVKVFSLPQEVKAKYAKPDIHYQRGWTPPFKEKAIAEKLSDAKENWFMGPEFVSDKSLIATYPDLYAPNVWPEEEEVWNFQFDMTILYLELHKFGRMVLSLVTDYLGLPLDYFEHMLRDAPTVMRAIYYPPISPRQVGNVVWGGKHTDINLVTVLPPSTGPGLWIRRRDGEWIPGRAPEGCVIMQVADMLQYLTSGYFLSAVHEVRAPNEATERGRYSAALFIHARSDVMLEPTLYFPPGRIQAYPPITAGELLRKRLQEIGLADKGEM